MANKMEFLKKSMKHVLKTYGYEKYFSPPIFGPDYEYLGYIALVCLVVELFLIIQLIFLFAKIILFH